MEWDCGQGVVLVFSAAEDQTSAIDVNGGFLTSALLESDLAKPPSTENPLTIGSVYHQIRVSVQRQNQAHKGQGFCQQPVLSCSHFASLTSPLYI